MNVCFLYINYLLDCLFPLYQISLLCCFATDFSGVWRGWRFFFCLMFYCCCCFWGFFFGFFVLFLFLLFVCFCFFAKIWRFTVWSVINWFRKKIKANKPNKHCPVAIDKQSYLQVVDYLNYCILQNA